ncbi:MAG: AGE family epimerase/isomerase [Bacteroidales bacterium]|nr:AGE family epimerase/isomerase [Bacteroidales bacterium]
MYKALQKEFEKELKSVLTFWSTKAIDKESGQYLGEMDHYGTPCPEANKGIIMYSRIMWTFSAACRFYQNEDYKKYADLAKSFIEDHFLDKKNGGVYWETDCNGNVVVNKKQVYAEAFTIYAYAEYALAFNDKAALDMAMDIFEKLETICYDKKNGGYFEAFSQTWEKLDDVRLSVKDLNEPKGMNTNLHVLEAYTTLYEATKNPKVGEALKKEIEIYMNKIVNDKNHVTIFFSENWKPKTTEFSYGHDIESTWLIWEAAEMLGDKQLLEAIRPKILAMVDTFIAEGFDKETNSTLYEIFPEKGTIDKDRHWWVQIEAVEGLANAFDMTGKEEYRTLALKQWEYIRENLIDRVHGEWFWRIDDDGFPVDEEAKMGMWKCPYHNGRGLMHMIKEMDKWQ